MQRSFAFIRQNPKSTLTALAFLRFGIYFGGIIFDGSNFNKTDISRELFAYIFLVDQVNRESNDRIF